MVLLVLGLGLEFPSQDVHMASRCSSGRLLGTIPSWLEMEEVPAELFHFSPLFRFFLNIPLTGSISAITPCLEVPGSCGSCRRWSCCRWRVSFAPDDAVSHDAQRRKGRRACICSLAPFLRRFRAASSFVSVCRAAESAVAFLEAGLSCLVKKACCGIPISGKTSRTAFAKSSSETSSWG